MNIAPLFPGYTGDALDEATQGYLSAYLGNSNVPPADASLEYQDGFAVGLADKPQTEEWE